MRINEREISSYEPPYIIAEISCNHAGKLENAIKLIDAAKQAGADAVKFQAYEADTITINCDHADFVIKDGPWKHQKLYDLYKQAQTPFDWFPVLFGYAASQHITAFASVFDPSSVNMLERLDCPAYKIASMEITDIPLVKYAHATGKPLIISTGMASNGEIESVVKATRDGRNAVGLACVSGYPTEICEFDLHKIGRSAFVRGISDHSLGSVIPVAATVKGAQIIEKHLMLGGFWTEDADFSMTPGQFSCMCRDVRQIWRALNAPSIKSEASTRQLRRSLYVVQDVAAGEPFTLLNVRSIRPAYGMDPEKLPWVLTKIAAIDLKRGTALRPDHISSKTHFSSLSSSTTEASYPES